MRPLHHVGYWVDDLDEAVDRAVRTLGVGPFLVHPHVRFESLHPGRRHRDRPTRRTSTTRRRSRRGARSCSSSARSTPPTRTSSTAYGIRTGAVGHVSWVVDDLDGRERAARVARLRAHPHRLARRGQRRLARRRRRCSRTRSRCTSPAPPILGMHARLTALAEGWDGVRPAPPDGSLTHDLHRTPDVNARQETHRWRCDCSDSMPARPAATPRSCSKEALRAAEAAGAEVELVRLDELRLPSGPDPTEPDDAWWFWEKLMEADGLVVSAPDHQPHRPGAPQAAHGPAARPERRPRDRREAHRDAGGRRGARRAVPPRRARAQAARRRLHRRRRRAHPAVEDAGAADDARPHVLDADRGRRPVRRLRCGHARSPSCSTTPRSRGPRSSGATSPRQLGRSFDEAEYVGEPGLCPLCHLDVIELRGRAVACATCGAEGRLADDFSVEWTDLDVLGHLDGREARPLRRDPRDRQEAERRARGRSTRRPRPTTTTTRPSARA